MLGFRMRHEHRLARVAVRLREGERGAVGDVDLHDLLKPAARAEVVAPRVAVRTLVGASVVDARQLEAPLAQALAADRAIVELEPEASERRLCERAVPLGA